MSGPLLIERRASASAVWARRIAVFAAVLLVTSTAGHRFGPVPTLPFLWLLLIVAGLAVLALLLAAAGFARLWQRGDRGGRASVRATLIAILVLLPFGFAAWRVYALPQLADVTTDTANPPDFFLAPGLRTAEMNPLRAWSDPEPGAQAEAYPTVTGRRYTLPLDRMQEMVATAADDLGWKPEEPATLSADGREATIELAAPSLVFGFVSDVAVRIVDEGETSYVDLRSASRYGRHDLGDNAAKIARFLDDLDTVIQATYTPTLQ
ncbi:MAG: DUF1499 domain-containing protein [Rhizobiales bacterium]|mgnify:FL=1|nr:DUF1499 domain-containing protein [Hyphomicrobiales bacterium]OJU37206.1 MAG: hypothetical protein BGN94_19010 [Rhizobiales bacterium 68-8]